MNNLANIGLMIFSIGVKNYNCTQLSIIFSSHFNFSYLTHMHSKGQAFLFYFSYIYFIIFIMIYLLTSCLPLAILLYEPAVLLSVLRALMETLSYSYL